jgi:hypothetical protein
MGCLELWVTSLVVLREQKTVKMSSGDRTLMLRIGFEVVASTAQYGRQNTSRFDSGKVLSSNSERRNSMNTTNGTTELSWSPQAPVLSICAGLSRR